MPIIAGTGILLLLVVLHNKIEAAAPFLHPVDLALQPCDLFLHQHQLGQQLLDLGRDEGADRRHGRRSGWVRVLQSTLQDLVHRLLVGQLLPQLRHLLLKSLTPPTIIPGGHRHMLLQTSGSPRRPLRHRRRTVVGEGAMMSLLLLLLLLQKIVISCCCSCCLHPGDNVVGHLYIVAAGARPADDRRRSA